MVEVVSQRRAGRPPPPPACALDCNARAVLSQEGYLALPPCLWADEAGLHPSFLLPANTSLGLGQIYSWDRSIHSVYHDTTRKVSLVWFVLFCFVLIHASVHELITPGLVSIKRNRNTHDGHFGEMASWQMRGVTV